MSINLKCTTTVNSLGDNGDLFKNSNGGTVNEMHPYN